MRVGDPIFCKPMTPTTRRIVQAVLYEAIAVAFVGPALSRIFGHPIDSTLPLAALMSAIALGWNYVFNGLFETWEAHRVVKDRSFKRRLTHGLGFEGGLVLMLVPLMAYWLDTTLLEAFIANLGILAFFFVYAIAFTWAFDRVFGLPQSATGIRPLGVCIAKVAFGVWHISFGWRLLRLESGFHLSL